MSGWYLWKTRRIYGSMQPSSQGIRGRKGTTSSSMLCNVNDELPMLGPAWDISTYKESGEERGRFVLVLLVKTPRSRITAFSLV